MKVNINDGGHSQYFKADGVYNNIRIRIPSNVRFDLSGNTGVSHNG